MSGDYGRLKVKKNVINKKDRYVPFNIKTCNKCGSHFEQGNRHICEIIKENKK